MGLLFGISFIPILKNSRIDVLQSIQLLQIITTHAFAMAFIRYFYFHQLHATFFAPEEDRFHATVFTPHSFRNFTTTSQFLS